MERYNSLISEQVILEGIIENIKDFFHSEHGESKVEKKLYRKLIDATESLPEDKKQEIHKTITPAMYLQLLNKGMNVGALFTMATAIISTMSNVTNDPTLTAMTQVGAVFTVIAFLLYIAGKKVIQA